MDVTYRLAEFVVYDDYKGDGLIFRMKDPVSWNYLNKSETFILNKLLQRPPVGDPPSFLTTDAIALVERLQSQLLIEEIEPQTLSPHGNPPGIPKSTRDVKHSPAITLRQRLVGAQHIICVLAQLKEPEGLYRAYQYIQTLPAKYILDLPVEVALSLVRGEYWWYRLITGLLEHRVAHLFGQVPGEEGLCMVRAFALCTYLRSLGLLAQVLIGRPQYGSRGGFDLHAWVEMNGRALNEVPNIRDGYRIIFGTDIT